MAEKIEFSLNVIEDKLNTAIDNATKNATGLNSVLKTASGVFAGGVLLKGFELLTEGIGKAVDVLFESIDASAAQEQATKSLNIALAQTGIYSQETSLRFQELASSIQATTIYEDDAVLSSMALLQNLGKLSSDGLERATRASVDLSAALGIDLETASQLVAKSANGNITAFQRYGIAIEKGTTDTQTFANTLQTLEQRFGGVASKQVQTFSGAMLQLKNAIGDGKEELGNLITQNPAVIAAIGSLKEIVNALSISFKNAFGGDNSQVTAEFFRAIFDGVAFTLTAFDALGRMVTGIVNGIQLQFRVLALGVQTVYAAVVNLLDILPGTGDSFSALAESATQEMFRLSEGIDQNIVKLQTFATEDTFTSGIVDGIANARGQFDALYNDIKTKGDDIQNNPNASNGDTSANDQAKAEAEKLKEQQLVTEINAIRMQGMLDGQLQKEQYQLALNEAEGVSNQAEFERIYNLELQKTMVVRDAEIERNNLTLKGRQLELANQKANDTAYIAASKLRNKLEIDSAKETQREKDNIQKATVSSIQNGLQQGLSLAKEGSKAQKAILSAQAIMSTYTGATAALAPPPLGLGPLYGIPLAAITVAAGLANVARINGASFATGGVIGSNISGASMGGDNTTANVRTGEMVLNADQQGQLFNAISTGRLGNNQPIVIQINGREIAMAVRDEIRGGFAL